MKLLQIASHVAPHIAQSFCFYLINDVIGEKDCDRAACPFENCSSDKKNKWSPLGVHHLRLRILLGFCYIRLLKSIRSAEPIKSICVFLSLIQVVFGWKLVLTWMCRNQTHRVAFIYYINLKTASGLHNKHRGCSSWIFYSMCTEVESKLPLFGLMIDSHYIHFIPASGLPRKRETSRKGDTEGDLCTWSLASKYKMLLWRNVEVGLYLLCFTVTYFTGTWPVKKIAGGYNYVQKKG